MHYNATVTDCLKSVRNSEDKQLWQTIM